MSNSLKLSYSDVYKSVSAYLGLGTSPAGDDLTKVKDIVSRAYRRFLMPIDTSSGTVYRWSFLNRTATMSTVSGTSVYDLPEGFGGFSMPFKFTTPMSYNPVEKPIEFIYQQRTSTTATGYPLYYALQTGDYDQITGQRYKVDFWPTPNGVYNYYYTYIFTPPKLINDDDLFVGDELSSEIMLELAMAVAELQEKDGISNKVTGLHSTEANALLQAAIGRDKRATQTGNLGSMNIATYEKFSEDVIIKDENGNQILPAL